MRRLLVLLACALGAFLVVRAVVELFVIDLSDPATYENDWGGPGLAGVLAVHCGPGLLVVVAAILLVRRAATTSDVARSTDPRTGG